MMRIHLFSAVLLAAVSCGRQSSSPPTPQGEINEIGTTSLGFAVSGIVDRLAVSPGQIVTAGVVMATLRTDEADARVNRTRDSLIAAEQRLQELRTNHLKILQLVETGGRNREDAGRSERDVESALGKRNEAGAALDQAQRNRLLGTLYTPFDGEITSVLVESNQSVKAGQTAVLLRRLVDP